jgi:hypothetical protein
MQITIVATRSQVPSNIVLRRLTAATLIRLAYFFIVARRMGHAQQVPLRTAPTPPNSAVANAFHVARAVAIKARIDAC